MCRESRRNAVAILAGICVTSVIAVIVFAPSVDASAGEAVVFGGGDGTVENPYLIETAGHLDSIRYRLDGHFRLVSDIDLGDYSGGEGWTPIGSRFIAFRGTFDGGGHKISNLTVRRPESGYVGLFGFADAGSAVRNLRMENVDVVGGGKVGGLIGSNAGTVTGIHVTGNVSGTRTRTGGIAGSNTAAVRDSRADVSVEGGDNVGGLVGWQYGEGEITGCRASGTVTGGRHIGGLVGFHIGLIVNSYAEAAVSGEVDAGGLTGWHYGGYIRRSYAGGAVSGTERVGGLTGSNTAVITDTFSTAEVTGDSKVGGLAGRNRGRIAGSYAAGSVTGNWHTGGLVGHNLGADRDDISGSYYDMDATGQEDNGKGAPLSAKAMMQKDTFTGWDFDDIWSIDEGEKRPVLIMPPQLD